MAAGWRRVGWVVGFLLLGCDGSSSTPGPRPVESPSASPNAEANADGRGGSEGDSDQGTDAEAEKSPLEKLRERRLADKNKAQGLPQAEQAELDVKNFNRVMDGDQRVLPADFLKRVGEDEDGAFQILFLVASESDLMSRYVDYRELDVAQEAERSKQRQQGSLPDWGWTEVTSKQVSVFQPILNEARFVELGKQYDEVLAMYGLGHVAVPAATSTALARTHSLTPTPAEEQLDKLRVFETYLSEPKSYREVFSRVDASIQRQIELCLRAYSSTSFVMPWNEQLECNLLFQGLTGTTQGHSPTSSNNAFERLFDRQNIAIWQPCPRKGFKCLGHLVSTADAREPQSALDYLKMGHPKQFQQFQHSQIQAPMFCVREDALVRGKVEPMHRGAVLEGGVRFYRVVPQDARGLGSNHFIARGTSPVPQCEHQKDDEVWVLNRDRVYLLPGGGSP